MKTKIFLYTSLVGFFLLSSCNAYKNVNLSTADWLMGTWEIKSSKGVLYESWKKGSYNEFVGKSYIIKDNDTLVLETIQLINESDRIFYIPTVNNQNEGLPIRFEAKTFAKDSLLFENQEHDFPQNISYTKITKDSIVAKISGTVNGEVRSQTFRMRRVR